MGKKNKQPEGRQGRPICTTCKEPIFDRYGALYNMFSGDWLCSWCGHEQGKHLTMWTEEWQINQYMQN